MERGDLAAALRHALDAWRWSKHERIAALVDTLSRRVAPTRERPTGKTVADRQQRWLAIAAEREPADLANLLATLTEVKKRTALEPRLAAIAGRSDPRIATALHDLLEHPPIPGPAGVETVRSALGMLIEIGDPRSSVALEHIARVNATGGYTATIELRRMLPATLASLRGARQPLLTPWDASVVDAIERALEGDSDTSTRSSAAALYAAVYARPDDDQRRSVLADALQELGDPRGELIALQLVRGRDDKPSRRERALLKQHARAWLGEIAPIVVPKSVAFERGFLAKCAVTARGIASAASLTSRPEWATVEELDVERWDAHQIQALANAMPVLRVLRGIQWGYMIPSHARLEVAGVRFLDAKDVPRMLALEVPALRELAVEWCYAEIASFEPLFASALGSRLRSLCLEGVKDDNWIPRLAASTLPRAGVRYSGELWRLWFEDDRITAEHIAYDPPDAAAGDELAARLARCPSPERRHVVIARAIEPTPELDRALRAFASHRMAGSSRVD
ncbi:MAG TPA: TIGR02996 domain-containing protein [Kofleriaceae bacterium]|nr:TIGR02996 domain-containing protein [Kofleriaceae bacterium]